MSFSMIGSIFWRIFSINGRFYAMAEERLAYFRALTGLADEAQKPSLSSLELSVALEPLHARMLSCPPLPSLVLDTLQLGRSEELEGGGEPQKFAADGGHVVLEEKAQDGVNGRTSSLVALNEQPVGCRAKVLVRLPRLRCHLALASRTSSDEDVVVCSEDMDGRGMTTC